MDQPTDLPVVTPEPLRVNARDWGPEIFKVVAQAFPVVGPAVASIVDFLPAQRIDRVVKFISEMDARLQGAEAEIDLVRERVRSGASPEAAALLEQGLYAAARATSRSRLCRISRIVADRIKDDEAAAVSGQRLLRILESLDDVEIKLLEVLRDTRKQLKIGDLPPSDEWPDGSTEIDFSGEETRLDGWTEGADLLMACTRLASLGLLNRSIRIMDSSSGFDGYGYSIAPAGALTAHQLAAAG